MRKIILYLFLAIIVSGCATTATKVSAGSLPGIGMTRGQVYKLIGSPTAWTRKVIGGTVYETYFYDTFVVGNYDFVDGVVVGYSGRDSYLDCMNYHSEKGIEKSRDVK
jgi:uncharacterized protein YceK